MYNICITIGALGCGGAERAASTLANYLAQKGYIIHILTTLPTPPFYPLDKRVIFITPDKDPRMKGKVVGALWISRFIRRKLVEISPDSVLNFIFPSFFMFATIGLNIDIFLSIRNDPTKISKYDRILLRNILFRKAKGIIAQTAYAKRVLERQTSHNNIKVIPNFVKPMKKGSSLKSKDRTIVCAGRLIKGKGYDQLLDIFSIANKKVPGWRLAILGDGPERGNLITLAKSLGIRDKVDFRGYQTDIDEHLQSAKIFAFCSQSEGFPNALLEAMATPLPCIAYDCIAGPSEIIEDGINGFLIPLNDKSKFADKLLALMEDESIQERFRSNAIKVRENYSIQTLGERYLSTILAQ